MLKEGPKESLFFGGGGGVPVKRLFWQPAQTGLATFQLSPTLGMRIGMNIGFSIYLCTVPASYLCWGPW